MRAIFTLALALAFLHRATAGCGPLNPTPDTPWGAAKNGLSTRILSLEKDPAVGQKLKVQLEVKNVDSTPKTFDDQQSAVNGSLIVKGPDGKDVPYIGLGFQTMGSKTTLAPGATKVVVKELDVAEQYLIEKPGKYTVQSRERGGLPASNELTMTLKAGELAGMTKLFASIHRAAPAGWRAARYGDSIELLSTPTNLKADATSISLYFTKDDKQLPMGLQRAQPFGLGETKFGHAWIVRATHATERWPDHEKFFQDQLKPFAKTN
jgi:hypothetical protein